MLKVRLGGDAAVKETARGLGRVNVGGLGEDGPTMLRASRVAGWHELSASSFVWLCALCPERRKF